MMHPRFAVAALSFSLVCLFPLSSYADTLTLVSTSGYNYPYEFDINGSSAQTPLVCLDDSRGVLVGEQWDVTVMNLATVATNATVDGASDTTLREDAYIYSQFGAGGVTDEEFQDAIWDILDSSLSSSLDGTSQLLVTDAQNAQAGLSSAFLSQFTLYVPVVPNGDTDPTDPDNPQNPGSWESVGEPQQFLGYTPDAPATPEPSSLLLLGTGMLSAFGLLRRRIGKETATQA